MPTLVRCGMWSCRCSPGPKHEEKGALVILPQSFNQDQEKMEIFPTVEQTGALSMGGSSLMPQTRLD